MGFFSKLFTGVSSWSDADLQQELSKTYEDSKKAQNSLDFSDRASIERWEVRNESINLKQEEILAEIKKRGISENNFHSEIQKLVDEYKKKKG